MSVRKIGLVIARDYWGTNKGEETGLRYYEFLRSHIGVNSVDLLLGNDVCVATVKSAITQFIDELTTNDCFGYLYIVGHGNQVIDSSRSEDDECDEIYQLPDGFISDDWFTQQAMRVTRTKSMLIMISDHCRSGSMIDNSLDTNSRWVSIGSSLDNEDSFASGDGNVMTDCLINYLGNLSGDYIHGMTARKLAEILPQLMAATFIGELQHPVVRASPTCWDEPLFPSYKNIYHIS